MSLTFNVGQIYKGLLELAALPGEAVAAPAQKNTRFHTYTQKKYCFFQYYNFMPANELPYELVVEAGPPVEAEGGDGAVGVAGVRG